MPSKLLQLLPLFICFVFFSCDSNRVFDTYKSLPNQWHKDSVVSFTVNINDTLKKHNLYINLRNTNNYKFSNLFLIVGMNYPNGKTITDTLEYMMAKPNGELLGKGFTDLKENKLWYKGYNAPFVFEEIGDYKINIKQAMRKNGSVKGIENLSGITELGFRVETTSDKL